MFQFSYRAILFQCLCIFLRHSTYYYQFPEMAGFYVSSSPKKAAQGQILSGRSGAT